MDRAIPTVIVALATLLAFFGMYWGWRSRTRGQGAIPRPPEVPEQLGAVAVTAQGLYVATTLADQPLERVTVNGLGFRARTALTVAQTGIVLELTGQAPAFVAASSLRSVDRASFAIDKAVEQAGLVRIGWSLGDTNVDSYLRIDSSAGASTEAVLAAASALVKVAK